LEDPNSIIKVGLEDFCPRNPVQFLKDLLPQWKLFEMVLRVIDGTFKLRYR